MSGPPPASSVRRRCPVILPWFAWPQPGTSAPDPPPSRPPLTEWQPSETSDPFDALLLLGDNVYPAGDPAQLDAAVFDPFSATLDAGAQLLPVLGNHDVQDNNGDDQARALGMPARRTGPARLRHRHPQAVTRTSLAAAFFWHPMATEASPVGNHPPASVVVVVPGHSVIGVVERLGDEPPHMTPSGPVELAAAISTDDDETSESQFGQVLAGGCGRGAGEAGERADVVLIVAEEPHQSKTGGVGEQRERCGRGVDLRRIGHLSSNGGRSDDVCSFAHRCIVLRG